MVFYYYSFFYCLTLQTGGTDTPAMYNYVYEQYTNAAPKQRTIRRFNLNCLNIREVNDILFAVWDDVDSIQAVS